MENLVISTQLLNNILAYLGTRPYQETYQLITALQDEAKEQLPEEQFKEPEAE